MEKMKQSEGFFDEQVSVKGTVVAVLIGADGQKKWTKGFNIVTTKGNLWYAARGALSASGFQVLGMKLGASTATAGSAGDLDIVGTSFTSCFHSLDTGYPMLSDTDTDNTGAGSNVVCWRATWSAAGGPSQTSICEVALCSVSASPGALLNRALFAASFDKTTSDTLKVFVNHTFTGV